VGLARTYAPAGKPGKVAQALTSDPTALFTANTIRQLHDLHPPSPMQGLLQDWDQPGLWEPSLDEVLAELKSFDRDPGYGCADLRDQYLRDALDVEDARTLSLTPKVATKWDIAKASAYLAPLQVGVGRRGGVESEIRRHATSSAMQQHWVAPHVALATVDFSYACKCVR
jgi:hypothetical protein